MRKILLLITAMIGTMSVSANHLTPSEALARAVNETSTASSAKRVATQKVQPVYSVDRGSQSMAYVFASNDAPGFIVVSADDCVDAVLGYSDDGTFDAENIPENMQAWLDGYARQIEWAAAHHVTAAKATVKQRADVAPKVTTMWNQDAPYNNLCPVVSNKHCYTGCVATAMAQILNYHKWPERGTGSTSYTCKFTSGSQTLSMDFSEVTFEWDKMLDEYTSKSPEENQTAVATLMKACGYAAQMVYSTSASGALSNVAARGLVNYLGYDRGLSIQLRDWYGIEEWADLVYDELTTNGPVYYDGEGTGGGHAFVCDGYRSADGFFHFNWGWGGMSNGYFKLSALEPQTQGAGGVSYAYNWEQSIMKGLRKAQEGSPMTYVFAPYAGVNVTLSSQTLGKNVNFLGYETSDGYCNYSLFDVDSLTLGIKARTIENNAVRYIPSNNVNNTTMASYTRENGILITLPTDLAEGAYEMSPVYKVGANGQWTDMMFNSAFRNSVFMDVTGTTATFSLAKSGAQPEVKILEYPEYFTSSGDFTIKTRIYNRGTEDFIGYIRACFWSKGKSAISIDGLATSEQVVVAAGDSIDVDYTSAISSGSISDGEYYLFIGNGTTGEIISDFYDAAVGNKYGSLVLQQAAFTIANKTFVDCNSLTYSATITCPQGVYTGPIALLISKVKKPFNQDFILESEELTLTAVETKQFSCTTPFYGGEEGETYHTKLGYKLSDGTYTPINDDLIMTFTVGQVAGIDDVSADDAQDAVYYTIDGRQVTNPEKGIYLRRSGDKVTKVIIK